MLRRYTSDVGWLATYQTPLLAIDLERTMNAWTASKSASPPWPEPRSSDLEHVDLTADNRNTTATLVRVRSKADFRAMHVVGQFSCRFIVACLCKMDGAAGAANDDLFIVDQHAADEKYNFETLQTTTQLESQ